MAYRQGKTTDRPGTDSGGDASTYSLNGIGIYSWPIATFTASGTYQTIPLSTALEVARVAIVVTAVSGAPTSITANVNFTPNGGALTPLFANPMRIDNLTLNMVTYFVPDNPLLVIPTLSLMTITHTFTGGTAPSITFGLSLAATCVDPLNYKTKDGNPGSNAAVAASGASNYSAALAGW
jgi:hypothetical protein